MESKEAGWHPLVMASLVAKAAIAIGGIRPGAALEPKSFARLMSFHTESARFVVDVDRNLRPPEDWKASGLFLTVLRKVSTKLAAMYVLA